MGRSERLTSASEIKRNFREFKEDCDSSGPVIYYENGRKYYDDSEAHIAVVGRTGKGKSQIGSLPFIHNSIISGNSFIVLDPKGECYRKTSYYAEKNHDVRCIDFRNPRNSPSKWDPLSSITEMLKSCNLDFNDIGSSMLSEMADDIYPVSVSEDHFWPDAAGQFFKGLVYALLEIADDDEINIDSVSALMEKAETKVNYSTCIKELYESLPENSLARRHLETYVSAPNDTRASIHSVAVSGMRVFSQSKGLMNMICQDTLHINDLDIKEKPLAIYIIVPDETSTYDALAGLLVSQLTQHFIRLAQDKYNGRLPHRMNVILEEVGSIGKSIKMLPNLMTAARSRNIRLMLVLQSYSQLVDVYGKSNAETINASIGITMGFSTNSWETLNEWSQRCGEREVERNGVLAKEPLLTASQLAAMPTATALIMIDNKYKYISHFPFYNEMYDCSECKEPIKYYMGNNSYAHRIFDSVNYVKTLREKKREDLFGDMSRNPFASPKRNVVDEKRLDDIIKKIDEKIAEIEDEDSDVE